MHGRRLSVAAAVLLLGLAMSLASAGAGGTPSGVQGSAAEVDWTRAQPYDVILTEFHFAPTRIVLREGEHYALRLENAGRFRHSFTAPEFFRTVAFRPGGAATEAEQSGGSLSIAAGEVEEIDLVPLQAGTFSLECSKPLHGFFGMTGEIVVQ